METEAPQDKTEHALARSTYAIHLAHEVAQVNARLQAGPGRVPDGYDVAPLAPSRSAREVADYLRAVHHSLSAAQETLAHQLGLVPEPA